MSYETKKTSRVKSHSNIIIFFHFSFGRPTVEDYESKITHEVAANGK